MLQYRASHTLRFFEYVSKAQVHYRVIIYTSIKGLTRISFFCRPYSPSRCQILSALKSLGSAWYHRPASQLQYLANPLGMLWDSSSYTAAMLLSCLLQRSDLIPSSRRYHHLAFCMGDFPKQNPQTLESIPSRSSHEAVLALGGHCCAALTLNTSRDSAPSMPSLPPLAVPWTQQALCGQ